MNITYCCGEVEGIVLFNSFSMEIDPCCSDENRTDNCMHNEQVVSKMTHTEFQSANILKLQALAATDVPKRSLPAVAFDVQSTQRITADFNLHPPPLRLMLQSFLC